MMAAQTTVQVKEASEEDNFSTKKNQCVTDITLNFFAGKDANGAAVTTSGLDQFNNYVNTLCPTLDLRVPSKYRTKMSNRPL